MTQMYNTTEIQVDKLKIRMLAHYPLIKGTYMPSEEAHEKKNVAKKRENNNSILQHFQKNAFFVFCKFSWNAFFCWPSSDVVHIASSFLAM